MSFLGELKRRNVFRMGLAYVLVAWLLLQGVDFALEVIDAPSWILQVFVIAAVAGLPVVLIFSWVFELTPEGIKLESQIDRTRSITPQTGRKLDRLIIAALGIAVVVLLADRFITSPGEVPAAPPAVVDADVAAEPAGSPAAAAPAERSVAVLPFLSLSSGDDDEYFADGLTEEILNALAQLPELLVTARTSSFAFKGQDLPVQEIATALGVRHIVEGSVRRAGDRLRVTAQLIRADDGFHVWSENYDSTEQDTIAVQEDIAEKIALAMDVVLDDAKREAMRRAGLRDVEAFIAFQKGIDLFERAHGDAQQRELLRRANGYFEKVLQRVPGYAPAYIEHSDYYIHILVDHATGQSLPDVPPNELEEALPRAIADFEAAVRWARDDDERANAELDLAFVRSEWRGMPALIERYMTQTGCQRPMWIDNIAVPAGYAAGLHSRSEELIQCDPLLATNWWSTARQLLWAGNPAGAAELATQGLQRAPGPWLYNQLIAALVAQGKFDEAEQVNTVNLRNDENAFMNRVLIAAARGDRAAVDDLLRDADAQPGMTDYFGLIFSAWAGDRERANGIARRIDGRPFGSPALTNIALWCACGAPFDLAVTPNFAEDISESGLAWPPSSPIRFPLKEAGYADRVAAVR